MTDHEMLITLVEGMADIKEDVAGIKGEIIDIKGDIVGIKGDIVGIKGDIVGIKEDVAGVKEDIVGVKEDITGLKKDVSGLQQNVSDMQKNMVTKSELKECEAFIFDEINRVHELFLKEAAKTNKRIEANENIVKMIRNESSTINLLVKNMNEMQKDIDLLKQGAS